ncbi:MAG: hypothetical protein NXY57DRAFT_1114299 [Lentinula lateritia]|uniref:Uncharacterized protein n=1 Tax=Lentinula lateritia TaxID=40482 RepID=A0ABQ8VUQ7_9AGAR|nr:MAG: hypothetical protein NXY57DRAFT_1114299 [Lentinula lateritia]KAJ4498295.1 hypothetical protein C8R41DRAFT_818666 [Lentinula lateritia]
MKFSISTTYVVLSLLSAYVNANPVQSLSNIAIGVPRDQTTESGSTTPDPTLVRRSAISVSFEKGAKLSPTELSKTQEEARDKVQQLIIAAEGKLHTSGWVINWLNNPPKKVKPDTDQIKFSFTGPAVCTGGEPSTTSGRMSIDRRDTDVDESSGYWRTGRDRTWTRRASKSANGCSGFVQGEKLEIRDNQNKILYPV